MGDQIIHPDTVELKASYDVLVFPSKDLPYSYTPMIFAQWLRSFRYGCIGDIFKKSDAKAYYSSYHMFIENLMAKPDSEVRIAALSDDRDVCLGFSVSREDVLDYVYIQKKQRHQGIATKLIPERITTITHITKDGYSFWQAKHKQWKFNPFA